MKISFVLWDGLIGGAERAAVVLAGEFRRRGIEAGVVFVGSNDALRVHLGEENVPYRHLGFARGASVLRHPRRLADAVREQGADVAILDTVGYLGVALRMGGFRGAVIGVEHGVLIHLPTFPPLKRMVRRLDRASGVAVYDAEVAVSRFVEAAARRAWHRRRLVCIPHGVRLDDRVVAPPQLGDGPLQLGYAGRLVPGKGLNVLIEALELLARRKEFDVRLAIAGDGPLRPQLEEQVRKASLQPLVTFVGWIHDVTEFWSHRHLAVAPNDTLLESFCISIAEAMSCSRPAIVTNAGALPELVDSGTTGLVVQPGDRDELAEAISEFVGAPAKLSAQGIAARERIAAGYSLSRCADRYMVLAEALSTARKR